MPEFPDEEENRQKDYIVAKSPVLRVLLDPIAETDRDVWTEMVESACDSIRASVESSVDEEVVEEDFGLLREEFPGDDIFPENTEEEQEKNLFETLAFIGFEIGDEGEAFAVFGDIYERLALFGLVQPTKDAAGFVYKAIGCGVNWALISADDALGPFADFVNKKLNLKGL